MNFKEMNENIISKRWKERYSIQSNEVKMQLDKLENALPSEYTLKKGKRDNSYPEIGIVFELVTQQDKVVYGIVIKNHINSILGKDLLTVVILDSKVILEKKQEYIIRDEDMIIAPQIVNDELWKKGYAKNVDVGSFSLQSEYCFYDVVFGQYYDDYGRLETQKSIVGIYGLTTVFGLSKHIQQELIINGEI